MTPLSQRYARSTWIGLVLIQIKSSDHFLSEFAVFRSILLYHMVLELVMFKQLTVLSNMPWHIPRDKFD